MYSSRTVGPMAWKDVLTLFQSTNFSSYLLEKVKL